jgi:hypothetical protein
MRMGQAMVSGAIVDPHGAQAQASAQLRSGDAGSGMQQSWAGMFSAECIASGFPGPPAIAGVDPTEPTISIAARTRRTMNEAVSRRFIILSILSILS